MRTSTALSIAPKYQSRRKQKASLRRVVRAFDVAVSLARISLEAGEVERAARHLCYVASELRPDLLVVARAAGARSGATPHA